jgi:hypothetical protein
VAPVYDCSPTGRITTSNPKAIALPQAISQLSYGCPAFGCHRYESYSPPDMNIYLLKITAQKPLGRSPLSPASMGQGRTYRQVTPAYLIFSLHYNILHAPFQSLSMGREIGVESVSFDNPAPVQYRYRPTVRISRHN